MVGQQRVTAHVMHTFSLCLLHPPVIYQMSGGAADWGGHPFSDLGKNATMAALAPTSQQFLMRLPDGFDAKAQAAYAAILASNSPREAVKRVRPSASITTEPAEFNCCVNQGVISEEIEERLVNVGEDARARRGQLIKETPDSLSKFSSEEDLRRYTVEALRKLARIEGLELGKVPSRERVVQELASLIASGNHSASATSC